LTKTRAVDEDLQTHAVGQVGFDLRQQRADAVDHLDRIGAGLALHRQHDGAVAVVPGAHLVVLDAVLGTAEILQPDRGAVPVGHDDLAEVTGIGKRHRRLHRIAAGGAVQRARRQVGVGGLHRRDHFGKAQPALLQLDGIEIQAQRVFLRTEHLHLGDAAHAGHALRHARVGDVVELGQRQAVGRQGQKQDR